MLKAAAAWGLDGHQSVGGEQLHSASFICKYIYIGYYHYFSVLVNSFYLNPSQPTSSTFWCFFFHCSFPSHCERGVGEQLSGAELPARLTHSTLSLVFCLVQKYSF